MDFALIEEHPWKTVAIIGVGALLLYLYLHRGGGGSSATAIQGGGGGGYASVDPNAAAAGVAQSQIQAQLAGLQIQTQGALQLKTLDYNATVTGVSAQQDVTNRQTAAALKVASDQTAAELAFGLGSQQEQIQLAQLSAGIQLASIQAIERAYGVLNGPTGPNNTTPGGVPVGPTVTNVGGSPGSKTQPPVYLAAAPPPVSVNPSGTVDPLSLTQGADGWWSNVTVPTPGAYGLDPNGGGLHCSPWDGACVAQQADDSNALHVAVANAQTKNNLTQGIENYQISVTAGVITPAQLADLNQMKAHLASLG